MKKPIDCKICGYNGVDADEHLDIHVQYIVDQAPPLTNEQRCRLAELLRPARKSLKHQAPALGVFVDSTHKKREVGR